MPYLDIGAMIIFGTLFYRAGDEKYDRGLVVGGVSVLLWIATAFLLGWNMLMSIAAQGAYFGLLTVIHPAGMQGRAKP